MTNYLVDGCLFTVRTTNLFMKIPVDELCSTMVEQTTKRGLFYFTVTNGICSQQYRHNRLISNLSSKCSLSLTQGRPVSGFVVGQCTRISGTCIIQGKDSEFNLELYPLRTPYFRYIRHINVNRNKQNYKESMHKSKIYTIR